MATARKVLVDNFEVHMTLSKDEAEFLRRVIGANISSNSDRKWGKIHDTLFAEINKIIPESNRDIKVRGEAVLYIEN